MDERQAAEKMLKQRKKYTALLSEMGKSLQEYEVLERETAELDE